MAKLFGSQIDLFNIPVLRFVPQSSVAASPPSSPANGQLWYDTTNKQLKIADGGTFSAVGSGAGGPPTGAAGGDLAGSSYPNPTITTNAVTYAKFQQVAANALVGNPTGSTANATGVTLAADHAFATGSLQLGAFTGDITKAAASLATTIAANAVTYAKMQTVGASRLLGNPTGGTAVPSEISLAADLAFSGTTLQTAAYTGDVTKTAGGTATTIAANAVTYAKFQQVAASSLVGNPTGALANAQGITLAADHSFSGTTLQLGAFTGDITKAAGSLATTIAGGAVTVAKLASSVTLDAIATAYPTAADLPMNNKKITGLATPVSATDAATKGYADSLATGLDVKGSARIGSTANISGTYNATGGTSGRGQFTAMSNAAIDGVTPAANDRVLVKNQTTPAQNGIYVITTLGTGANGVWDRTTDFDQDAEVTSGAFVFVEEGTVNNDTGWVLSTNNPITIGGASGTSLTFTQFSGAGAYTAGNGLTQTGTTFDVVGTTNRITVAADSVDIAATYVGQTSITTLGTVTTGTWNGTTVATANGGTGVSTAPTPGAVVWGATASTQGYSAAGTAGQMLHSGGTGVPTWAAVNLASATEVTGTLGLANGGTGGTSAATARTSLGAVGKYNATLGALSAGVEANINHALNSTEVIAQFRDASTNFEIVFSWRVVDANNIGVTADVAFGANAVKVVVIG